MDRAALTRCTLFALGLVVSGAAVAQPSAVAWPNVVLKYATNGTPLLQPRVPLASTAAGGGAATLNASQRLAIGNASVNLQLTRNVPLANVAKVARVAARFLGPLALAGLVYEGVQWADGAWQAEEERTRYTFGGSTEAFTVGDALAYYASASPQYAPGYVHSGEWGTSSQVIICSSGWPGNACQFWQKGGSTTTELVPADDETLEISFQQGLIASPSLAGQVLDAALASSEARAQLVADALQVAGPATVDGGTQTSTKVETAGTTTIQTATTYNLTYNADTVNVTQTTIETVTDPSSNVTTTTTTTEAPTGDPPPPEEQSKFCEEFPDASACQELGEHEPDGELGEEQRSLSWSPELSAAGSCPAPITLSIMGSTQSLEWSSVCDLASGVRPVVIALAWLSAAVFVFGVGRVTAS